MKNQVWKINILCKEEKMKSILSVLFVESFLFHCLLFFSVFILIFTVIQCKGAKQRWDKRRNMQNKNLFKYVNAKEFACIIGIRSIDIYHITSNHIWKEKKNGQIDNVKNLLYISKFLIINTTKYFQSIYTPSRCQPWNFFYVLSVQIYTLKPTK